MKLCKKCLKELSIDNFFRYKNGYKSQCKECSMLYDKNNHRTINGLIKDIYGNQRNNSRLRGHINPEYNLNQLRQFAKKDENFIKLFKEWVNSNYRNELTPSYDRIDNNKHYTFNNIKITTWIENKKRGHDDMRNCIIIHGANPQKSVIQYDLNMNKIKEFNSIMNAVRQTGISSSKICQVCSCKYGRKTTGGYIWRYK